MLSKENIRKLRGLIIFTALVFAIIWKFSIFINVLNFMLGIIFPFILGGALAFIINVPMSYFERLLFENKHIKKNNIIKKIKRPVSLLLTICIIIGGITLIVFGIVPQLSDSFSSLGTDIQIFAIKVKDWAIETFKNNPEIIEKVNSIELNWEKIVNTAIDYFKIGVGSVIDISFTTAKSIVNGLFTFFIGFVFSIYILLQKEKLRVQFKKVMFAFLHPKKVTKILEICALSYKTFANFLTGQCVEAVILGFMFVLTMSIIKLPYALLTGIIIAVTALIPIFGAFIGCGLGAFFILMDNPMQALIFIIVFLILQQIEGNIIYPRVVGSSVGLPSIWVLVAVSIGGSLMGIVGILIFIPITSILYTLFGRYVNKRLKNKKIKLKMPD